MKNLSRFLTILIVLSLVFSCNDDFLNESVQTSQEDVSTIFISPNWVADDYIIYCPGVGNAKFRVAHAPAWLDISSSLSSERFFDNRAVLNCKAKVHNVFSEVGIFHTYLTLSIEGKGNRVIPIAYINEGNPVIETIISYDNVRLSIKNTGNGILFWQIGDYPDWLLLSDENTNYILLQNEKVNVNFSFNPNSSLQDILSGKIVIESNDKNNPKIEVEVEVDFNPVIEVANSMTINFQSFYGKGSMLTVKNTGKSILHWHISEFPEWLSLTDDLTNYLLPQNFEGYVYFSYNSNVPFSENLSGKIVIESNDKNKPIVEVNLQIDMGSPLFNVTFDFSTIDFGRTEKTRQVWFDNRADGILTWKFEGCPDWLTISATDGFLSSNTSADLTFTCKRELLSTGVNTATIYLKTNDKIQPSYPITVIARSYTANPDNVKPIEGKITDAYLDKQTDILYLTTAQPNRFLAYNIKNRLIVRELSLNLQPNCFSLAEDGKTAIIGHNKYITLTDIDNFSVMKVIEVDYNIFDIEWGLDNWGCYTWEYVWPSYVLQWKNLDTEEKYDTPWSGRTLDIRTQIKRIPNQNYIVASSLTGSPSGITIFDTQKRTNTGYFHQDIGKFWFSSDGNHLFDSWNRIYRTSSLFDSSNTSVSPIGNFSPAPHQIHWIDYDHASHSLWVLSSSYSSWDELREIKQYKDNDFTRKGTYYYDDFHNGRIVQAHYVFANKEGTELVVIRNATSGDFMWSLEFISVE